MLHFLRNLFRQQNPICRRGATLRPTRRGVPLHVEALEQRIVPVVGTFAIPAPVSAGAGFDGVVQLSHPISPTQSAFCTGSLQSTGRHVLTAAHCVDDDGDGDVDAGTITVMFNMSGRNINLNVPMTDVIIHPEYDGLVESGNDLAASGTWFGIGRFRVTLCPPDSMALSPTDVPAA